MRKLLLLAFVLVALAIACENKSPTGPAGVGPGGVTVTQTTSSTRRRRRSAHDNDVIDVHLDDDGRTVAGSTSRRYVAFQPPSNIPADMTLFFELLTTPSLLAFVHRAAAAARRRPEGPRRERVQGSPASTRC